MKTPLKIFTVTKNEYDLIECFILYHASIVGFDNIIIIDNMSTDQRVLDVYNKYKGIITIVYEEGYQNSKQADHFIKYMSKYKDTCEFMMGLDTDEFIYRIDSNGNATNNKIIEYLQCIPKKYDMLRIKYYDNAIHNKNSHDYHFYKHIFPVNNINKFNRMEINVTHEMNFKTFYRSENFVSTSNGNHTGQTINNSLFVVDMGYLHFNDTGKERSIERAYNICYGYDYINSNDNKDQILNKLDYYAGTGFSMNGHHRVRELYYHLKREYVLYLFLIFIRRYPSHTELEMHVKDDRSFAQKKTEFINCEEASKIGNTLDFIPDTKIFNDLLYEDTEDQLYQNKNNIIECNLLINFFNTLKP